MVVTELGILKKPDFDGGQNKWLDGVEVTFADRLNTPNSDEGFDAVSGAVADVFAAAYGSPVIVERSENDPRLALRVKVTATTLPALAELSVSVPA